MRLPLWVAGQPGGAPEGRWVAYGLVVNIHEAVSQEAGRTFMRARASAVMAV